MAYDEGLAIRIEEALTEQGTPDVNPKKMFGGVAFMVRGNMACGVIGDNLIARVGPDRYAAALKRKNAAEFDFTGRPMRGWVKVAPKGYEEDSDLERWVSEGREYALTLPAK